MTTALVASSGFSLLQMGEALVHVSLWMLSLGMLPALHFSRGTHECLHAYFALCSGWSKRKILQTPACENMQPRQKKLAELLQFEYI